MTTWKEKLAEDIPEDIAGAIDAFAIQLKRKKQGELSDPVFGELRLRMGVYGQRYDNGKREDGLKTQKLNFPSGAILKGPDTLWDAPGMQRIKIPFGGVTADQLDVLADLAEEYSDGILHVTTRQDVQFHFVHIEDSVDIMLRLAAVGITTQEACGNTVRNITACPYAGICREESFDVTPYAKALAKFLLGHPDCRDFGRKFKISFSGCRDNSCGLAHMHDIGFIARKRIVDGKEARGFSVYVGGGLGAVPQQAMLFDAFLPENEIFSITQAIARVFSRFGEKQNRARARLKFLVLKLGIEEFRRIVRAEQSALPGDDYRIPYSGELSEQNDNPPRIGESLNGQLRPKGFETWSRANVLSQKQDGYCAVTIPLPLGDFTPRQARLLADISRNHTDGSLRFTAEQNIVLRWVSKKNLIPLYAALQKAGLDEIGPGTITDITACPGTDTCKLGIASSRGLARVLRAGLLEKYGDLDEAARNLRIKISGCFNSCGQHHIADIGFYGSSRTIGGYKVPHFQILLGGKWENNASSFGLAIGAVPSKRIPEAVDRIAGFFVSNREENESFQAFTKRIGKQGLRDLIEHLMRVPEYFVDPSFYSDWGDPREYSLSDLGIGECAGEVVSTTQFDLSDAEREVFEAQLKLERGEWFEADRLAYKSMITAAKALVKTEYYDVPDDADTIIREFKTRLFDTGLFSDRFAREKFGRYLLSRHAEGPVQPDYEHVRQLIEKAQLFIEASHVCYARLQEKVKTW